MTRSTSYNRYLSIATAAAAGSNATPIANPKVADTDPEQPLMTTPSTMTATANSIHFSCCRSSPRDRRNRTIVEARGRRGAISMNDPRRDLAPDVVERFKASTPSGIGPRWLGRVVHRPGQNQEVTVISTRTAPSAQRTGRHRRPGTLPSGKSSGRNAINPIAGNQAQRKPRPRRRYREEALRGR